MTDNSVQNIVKVAPPRPFPWRCGQCGERAVEPTRIEYNAQVRHDGRIHEFTVPDLEIPVCASCGEKVFTNSVDEQINAALRRHLTILSPEQIRDALRRIGVSQRELATRLRIAEATLSRWLTGTQIQSRSMDTLLRLYLGIPQVRKLLGESEMPPTLGLADELSHAATTPRN